jgi:predicted metalloprotease
VAGNVRSFASTLCGSSFAKLGAWNGLLATSVPSGVTSQRNRQIVDESDVESALNAAAAVGDDRLQRMAGGWVSHETFTHGTSAQRVHWFKRGFDSGDLSACDTFRRG